MVHGHFLRMGGVIFSVDGHFEYLDLRKLVYEDESSENDDQANGEKANPNDASFNEANPDEADLNEAKKYVEARKALKALPIWDREIRDRSKGDAITKSLTFLQTLWFIVQLAVRRAHHLNVTALEVVTLAYAVTLSQTDDDCETNLSS